MLDMRAVRDAPEEAYEQEFMLTRVAPILLHLVGQDE